MTHASRPNVLVIVADDLGFSDLGSFGGEISTPNLDRLADDGLRFTGFHTASACSPTRSMLLSGTDNHLAGLGQMAETAARNPVYQNKPGYEGVLNNRVAALPEILSANSYRTLMSGTWVSLAKLVPGREDSRKVLLCCPVQETIANAFEPLHAEGSIKFMPPLYMEDDKFVPVQDLPKPFYSSDAFTDNLLGFLESKDDSSLTKASDPFFAYLPFTAPHWPLQAPPEITAKYAGRYDTGPHALRAERLAKLSELGLVPKGISPHPVVPAYDSKDWDDLTEDERRYSARTMEVYAAMVERMDWNIGRVIDYLQTTGQLDNTLVFFSSDNGAEGALLEAIPIMGEKISKTLKEHYNNSYENIGNADSFVWYGPRWAQAATAPSRMYKAWITEGGIRCPAILRYPKVSPDRQNGVVSHTFTTVMDILPTILDLAGVQHPTSVGDGTFQNRTVLPPRGKSWVPYLLGQTNVVHGDDAVHGWELFNQGAIRRGWWKALWMPQASVRHGVRSEEEEESTQWELFNLEIDPGETKNLAKERPDILAELVQHWVDYVAETGTVLVIPEGDQKSVSLAPGYGPLK
ncbi:alkaline phosphatase-like protein [Ceratobasidium sp. AG-I]|nr:alkaline phosphatase-like protein [Ceratobasidium sp. AG-I]